MKAYFTAFCMCQSMFCALPFPFPIWDEKARDKMLPVLPLLGLELGLIWAGLAWLCQYLSLPGPLQAAALACCPFLLTGAIHLDGYMDVTDAVRSCRNLERRREILKDSHVGSFAVIAFGMLLLAQYSCFTGSLGDVRILIFLPAISRCCSALAVLLLPPMHSSQYARQSLVKSHIILPLLLLISFLLAGFFWLGRYALVLPAAILGYLLALRHGYRSLQGMNGDIAGYSLCVAELCGAIVFALL